ADRRAPPVRAPRPPGMTRLLGWPVRVLVTVLLLFSLAVDGAGRVPWLPASFAGVQVADRLGLDLAGGTSLTLQLRGFPPGRDPAEVQRRTIDVIQTRVNALGVSEPLVQAAGGARHDRIEVQLPGGSGAEAARLVGERFQLVITRWVPDASIVSGPVPGYRPEPTAMTSDMLTGATAELDPNGGTGWVVAYQFDAAGTAIYGQLTDATYRAACPQPGQVDCPERRLAFWLDLTPDDVAHWEQHAATAYQRHGTRPDAKLLVDAYTLQPIADGRGIIQGAFTQQSAKELAAGIQNGALPVTLDVLQTTTVSASVGAGAVRQSVAAGVLGLAVVVAFMVSLYRLPGFLASLALAGYALLVLAAFRLFTVTLTLAGLAGFVLSVGMAVDANVLIFERFKEEVRSGRRIEPAVEAAVQRAWPAIRDSNYATLITSGALILAAPGQIKGFAITLAIGVVASMLSSIVLTHNLLAIVLRSRWARTQVALGVTERAR
ncbi:MAG TPA: protein translocase subunit SecD, partial [Candidatus Dormibacteraeota bacterium]|nr:protein translocase subunit SecD [Candidatus Dormibacteraeota bacterium]